MPLPAPGQTVHWTLAGSPYRICSEAVIPAGDTLVIDPGVHVNFDANQVMVVRGRAAELKKIADKLIGTRGVKHGTFSATAEGKVLA